MKSSYKMYGSFWNRQFISEKDISVCCKFNTALENTICLSKILQNEEPIVFYFLDEVPVALLIDYFPSSTSIVVVEFFVKRILQIADYYNANVLICDNQNEANTIERMISEIKKKNTE